MTGNGDGPGRQQLLSLETNYMQRGTEGLVMPQPLQAFPKHCELLASALLSVCLPDNDKMCNDSTLRLSLTQVNLVNVDGSPTKYFLIII